MKKWFLLCFLAVALGESVARAAVVYLKDGSQVGGTIVGATARSLQLHTPDGDLTIDSERIERVDYNATSIAPAAPREERDEKETGLFSLGLGFVSPLSRINFNSTGGGSDDNGNTGFLISSHYLHRLSPRWAIGVGVEFFNRSDTGSQSLLPNSQTDVSGNTLLLMAIARYVLIPQGSVHPYLLAGLGANRTSTTIDATPNSDSEWSDTNTFETRTLVDNTRWGLASSMRLGVDFDLMDPAVFTLELGWTGLSNRSYPATGAGQDLGLNDVTGHLNILSMALRWGWRF
jgi:opacity protein-like surface antigen